MTVNIAIQASLDVSTSEFVIALYAASAPTVVIDTVVPTKPYGNPIQVSFSGLTYGLVYNVILWESTDGTPSGIARNSGSFTANANSVTLRSDLVLVADSSAGLASGGTSYTDPTNSLKDWIYSLEERGTGTLIPTTEYTLDSNNNFNLINGETIQPGQVFILHFKPQTAQLTPSQPSLISTGVVLTANTTLDNTYKNKAIYLQGAAAAFIIALPSLATMSDYDVLYFYSAGGSHINVSLVCSGTDRIQRNVLLTKIILGQNEQLKLFKASGAWQINNCSAGVDEVGRKFASDFPNEINAILATGQTVSRATYARLWDKVSSSFQLISQSSWANVDSNGNYINKGFYGTGDGSTTFTIPDLTVYGFRRATGSNAGAFEAQQIQSHTHAGKRGDSYSGSGQAASGYVGGGQATNPQTDFVTKATGGTETRPNNTKEYIYIRV